MNTVYLRLTKQNYLSLLTTLTTPHHIEMRRRVVFVTHIVTSMERMLVNYLIIIPVKGVPLNGL